MSRFAQISVAILIFIAVFSVPTFAQTFTDDTSPEFQKGLYVSVDPALKTNISGSSIVIQNSTGGIESSGIYQSNVFSNATDGTTVPLVKWLNISWSGILWNMTQKTDISDYDSGLVGYWKFDNDSAYGESDTLVYDYSGNGHNGTPAGGAAFNSSGYFNGSYSFDGSDDYISLGANAFGNIGGTNFTIAGWVKTSAISNYNMFLTEFQAGLCGDFIMGIYLPNGYVYLGDGVGTANYGNVSVADGNWHHIAYVYTGANGYTYVDGVQGADTTAVQWTNNCNVDVQIGKRADGYPFNGTIDSLRVYNRSLSASEVQAKYAAGRGLKTSIRTRTSSTTQEVYNTSGLVGFWKFNGDAAYGENSTNIYDYSGNGHNGTPQGGAAFNASGYFNGAYSLDGTNGMITVPNSADFDFGSGNFTVEWWENRNGIVSNSPTLSRDYAPTPQAWLLGYDSGTSLQVYMSSGVTWDIALSRVLSTTIDLNVWNYFAVVRNGNNFYTYKNGVQQDTWSSSGTLMTGVSDVIVGSWYSGTAFAKLKIDSLRMYKGRALSADEIKYNYQHADFSGSSWSSYFVNSPAILSQSGKYLQYEALLETNDTTYTPSLQSATLDYRQPTVSVPANKRAVLASNTNVDVTSTGQTGTQQVYVAASSAANNYTAQLYINFSAGDVDLSGVTIESDPATRRSVLSGTSSVPEIINKSLLIRRVSTTDMVYVCPNATALSQVSSTCTNRVVISVGETVNGMTLSTTTIDGFSYYVLSGITGTGGGEISTGQVLVSISSTASISLPTSTVNFGTMTLGSSNDTDDDSPLPFIIQNDGSVKVNVTISATDIWSSGSAANPSSYYQFKADNSSEGNCFNSPSSTTGWANMPGSATNFLNILNFTTSCDSAQIDVKVTVPGDEPAGAKSSTVTLTASEA